LGGPMDWAAHLLFGTNAAFTAIRGTLHSNNVAWFSFNKEISKETFFL
jgi:hypothetical protein